MSGLFGRHAELIICTWNYLLNMNIVMHHKFYLYIRLEYAVIFEFHSLQAEVRKREEKEAAENLRREQELREAKRQQQRLNFLIQQTELYSHFMQNKSNLLSSEALPMVDENTNDQDALGDSSDAGPNEDPEEAELKKEALKAAQEAVSKQRMLTSAFDSECLRLRQVGETDALPPEVAGASNIDLQTP